MFQIIVVIDRRTNSKKMEPILLDQSKIFKVDVSDNNFLQFSISQEKQLDRFLEFPKSQQQSLAGTNTIHLDQKKHDP